MDKRVINKFNTNFLPDKDTSFYIFLKMFAFLIRVIATQTCSLSNFTQAMSIQAIYKPIYCAIFLFAGKINNLSYL